MNVLIADDEKIVLEGLKYIIDWNSLGFTICQTASDGADALEKILNLKPDLVMEAFCQFLDMDPESIRFQHHRLEMYTDRSEDGSLIPLEAMGVDMTGDEE